MTRPDGSGADILNDLAQDARVLRRARMLPDGPLNDEHIRAVANDFKLWLRANNVRASAVAKALGPGHSESTLLSFIRGLKKGGDNEGLARTLNAYMEQLARAAEVEKPQGYVETEVALRMSAVMDASARAKGFGQITGGAGAGKTIVLLAYNRKARTSIYLRVRRAERSDAGLVRSLGREMGLPRHHTTGELLRMIIDSLRGSARLLLIDEAHKLQHDAMEALRDIHDEADVGVVLCGTRDVRKLVDDYTANLGQFTSRTVARFDVQDWLDANSNGGGGRRATEPRRLYTVDEVAEVFASATLKFNLTDDAIAFLHEVACLPGHGHLRLAVRLVQLASMGRTAKDANCIDRKQLVSVVREMHGDAFVALLQEKAAQARPRMVKVG